MNKPAAAQQAKLEGMFIWGQQKGEGWSPQLEPLAWEGPLSRVCVCVCVCVFLLTKGLVACAGALPKLGQLLILITAVCSSGRKGP